MLAVLDDLIYVIEILAINLCSAVIDSYHNDAYSSLQVGNDHLFLLIRVSLSKCNFSAM